MSRHLKFGILSSTFGVFWVYALMLAVIHPFAVRSKLDFDLFFEGLGYAPIVLLFIHLYAMEAAPSKATSAGTNWLLVWLPVIHFPAIILLGLVLLTLLVSWFFMMASVVEWFQGYANKARNILRGLLLIFTAIALFQGVIGEIEPMASVGTNQARYLGDSVFVALILAVIVCFAVGPNLFFQTVAANSRSRASASRGQTTPASFQRVRSFLSSNRPVLALFAIGSVLIVGIRLLWNWIGGNSAPLSVVGQFTVGGTLGVFAFLTYRLQKTVSEQQAAPILMLTSMQGPRAGTFSEYRPNITYDGIAWTLAAVNPGDVPVPIVSWLEDGNAMGHHGLACPRWG